MQVSVRLRAVLQALLVTFLWSTSWVLIKYSIEDIPPLTFAGFRYAVAAGILLPGLFRYRDELRALSGVDWARLAALGLVFYTLTQGGQFMTLKYLGATTFSLLMNFTTVLVAVFGIFGLREMPRPLQWAGIAVFLAGVLVYFSPSTVLMGSLPGYLFAVMTICANALASLMGRAINRRQTTSPIVITTVSMGIGACVLLGTGLAVEEPPLLTPLNIGVILWLALINTAFAFTLWNKTLQILTAVESSVINSTMLVQIAILAWIFLGERPGLSGIAGLVIASIGTLLVNIKPGKAA